MVIIKQCCRLSLYCAILCLTAGIYGQKEKKKKDKTTPTSTEKDSKIYTFAFSNDGFPADFVDKGQLVGQSVDFVMEVCKFANKKCQPTLVQRKMCWDTTSGFPPFSEVLNGRYFDSCANYPESPERRMSYGFPKQHYFKTPEPSLVVSSSTKITINDLKGCNNLTLAFPANTALEPDCLLDAGLFIRDIQMTPVFSTGVFDLRTIMNLITKKVVEREVDLGIVITRFTRVDEVRILTSLPCFRQITSGLTNMFRIDDETLINWWGDAVHRYMCTKGLYEDFCKQLQDKYGIDPLCRTKGEDLDCSKFGGPAGKKKEPEEIRRIRPCLSEVCRKRSNLNFDTWRNGFFEISDQIKGNTPKALQGSKESYSGQLKRNVAFFIAAKDASLFRPDKVCVTVKNVKNIKILFRGGEREAETLNVLVDFRKEWTTHCERSEEFRRSIRIEFTITSSFFFSKNKSDKKIKVNDVFLEACTKAAFITD